MSNAEPLFITLYTDAHITLALVKALRERRFDAISVHEVGNSDLSDPEHLAYAAAHSRAILTFNSKDFVPLFQEWWEQGRTHHGVIVSAQIPIGVLLRRTLKLLNTVTADEMENNLKVLGEFAERDQGL